MSADATWEQVHCKLQEPFGRSGVVKLQTVSALPKREAIAQFFYL